MFKTILTAIALSGGLISTVLAGELTDKAAIAEKALQDGEAGKAISTMRSALVSAWKAAPLSIETAVFVNAAADGFGIYNERPDASFSGDQPLLVYLEPVGFTWSEGNGVFQSHLIVDFELLSTDGKVLAGQENFGEFEFTSRAHNTEYMFNLTINITGAPAAPYVLKITLRDQLNNDQAATVRLPFELN